jgi:hypothetical protein
MGHALVEQKHQTPVAKTTTHQAFKCLYPMFASQHKLEEKGHYI